MYYKYIVAITLGLFFGLIIAFTANFSTEIFLVSLLLSVSNFLVHKFTKRSFGVYKSQIPTILTFFFLILSLGILFGQLNLSSSLSRESEFQNAISHQNDFSGIISNVSISQNSQNFTLNIEDENFKQDIFKIKITTSLFPLYKAGDKILVTGKIKTENIILPNLEQNNKSFDSQIKNKLSGINGETSFPKIQIVSQNSSGNILYKLENIKTQFVKILEKDTNIDTAALSAGTLLGDSSLLSKEDINDFRIAGISHIIVLSGFNITILIFILIYIFSLLNLRLFWRVTLSIFSIIFFILFVGAGASIVRAGIMGSTLLLASLYGRQYVARQALFISAFVMMILNPEIALSDVSFHLSFLATLGILYLVPIFNNYKILNLDKIENKFIKKIFFSISEILKVTLAVQLMVMPYTIFTFGKISIFGIFANILAVPFVPTVMLFSVLIILFSFFANFISVFFGYVSYIFCEFIFSVARFISHLPFSQIEFSISTFSLFVIYVVLFLLINFETNRQKIKSHNEKIEK
ncbi:MAG: ComEC/Rec2 family competence protein [Candidatus Nomurabacteria bacterium]